MAKKPKVKIADLTSSKRLSKAQMKKARGGMTIRDPCGMKMHSKCGAGDSKCFN